MCYLKFIIMPNAHCFLLCHFRLTFCRLSLLLNHIYSAMMHPYGTYIQFFDYISSTYYIISCYPLRYKYYYLVSHVLALIIFIAFWKEKDQYHIITVSFLWCPSELVPLRIMETEQSAVIRNCFTLHRLVEISAKPMH